MKKIKFLHFFIPHSETHQKAHLLSWHALVIYMLLFMFLRVGIDLVDLYKPGVLGINSNITAEKVIQETNLERQKNGLTPLTENQSLAHAAYLKAQNMFEENYWAHFSPSGKDPWKFISNTGYKFSYAGENLARNFYSSSDVINAWMASASHRENILNPNYQDIGIAVVDGVLNGQTTTLVVQMFGKSSLGGNKISVNPADFTRTQPILIAGVHNFVADAKIDPFAVTKTLGTLFILAVAMLFILDFLILKKRGVFRVSSHHLAHLSFLAVAAASVILTHAGEIL